MAPRKPDPSGVEAAIHVATSSDTDDLRARSVALVNKALDEAEYTLRYGSPTDKAALTKHVLPTMLRALESEAADAKKADQYAAYQRMRAWARGDKPAPKKAAARKAPARKKAATKKAPTKKTAARKKAAARK